MLKKTLAATALAGALLFGTAAAASAYPVDAPISASDLTVAPGGTTVITVSDLGNYETVTFSVTGPAGASLASLANLAAVPLTIIKPVVDGSASATLTTSSAGTYAVTVLSPAGEVLASISITAAVPGAPASGGAALPPTGGSVPAAAIWVGVGAVGLGGIAVAAVAARRRTQKI